MPLHLIILQIPIKKWGLDYVTPIIALARGCQAWYIIVATDYLAKWVKEGVVQRIHPIIIDGLVYQ